MRLPKLIQVEEVEESSSFSSYHYSNEDGPDEKMKVERSKKREDSGMK